MTWPLDVPIEELRRRRGSRWTSLPDDVLPMSVAEMDVRLPASVADALRAALELSDTGYPGSDERLRAAFAGFAARQWGWSVEPVDVAACGDIATGATELLRCLGPGLGVVVMPPVYPRLGAWVRAAGATQIEVPMLAPERGGRIDLAGLRAALAAGARAVLLCHPHNPTGRIHPAEELVAVADLAVEYGALVLADEVHGPLALPGQVFTPYLSVSESARASGIALTSASKAWGIAGLKCAVLVAQGERPRHLLDSLRYEFSYGVGDLGLLAAEAAFGDEGWLGSVVVAVASNLALLGSLLRDQLPVVTWTPPQAGYLTWLDFRSTPAASDPAGFALDRARLALSPGASFGPGGDGFARLNVGCNPQLVREAVSRLVAALG